MICRDGSSYVDLKLSGRPPYRQNWDFGAVTSTGAIRSMAKDMLRHLKANMGIDGSPLAAAMKLKQAHRNVGKINDDDR